MLHSNDTDRLHQSLLLTLVCMLYHIYPQEPTGISIYFLLDGVLQASVIKVLNFQQLNMLSAYAITGSYVH